MIKNLKISPPFFEIGPKSYLYGEDIISLALIADEMSEKYDVQILFTCPFVSIESVAARTRNIFVVAPHMDPIPAGRGLADILPEAIISAGASGVMLNHAEKPILYSVLEKTISRAEEIGLFTIVCANSIAEIKSVANLSPDIIVAEPTELIGTGNSIDLSYMEKSTEAIQSINPNILILQAAGIANGQDVYNAIYHGADATGSSSAIALATDKRALVEEMISAVRKAWDDRQKI